MLENLMRKYPDLESTLVSAIEVSKETINTFYKFSMAKLKLFLRFKEVACLVKFYLDQGLSSSTLDDHSQEWLEELQDYASIWAFQQYVCGQQTLG